MNEAIDDTPKTPPTLNILLPTIFPIDISASFLMAAITLVTSSGMLVPTATTIKPII